jgi:hypothetical protein
MATSLPRASDIGILANGTDQTSALNTAFANSLYAGIIIDFSAPADVTINGTLNCGGKQLIFAPGSRIVGTGTISSCVINAGYRQQCFTISISLTGCSVANEKFSVMWYGAIPGTTDSQPAIQQSVNTVVANHAIKTVFIPAGSYNVNSAVMIYSLSGSSYAQCSITLEGESSFWEGSATGSVLTANGYKNTFLIGVQLGKGVQINKLKLVGGFIPPFSGNPLAFYSSAWSAFTDGSSRDSVNSPFTGIAIDPFGPSIPGDGGYPGMSSWYTGGSGGSTGVTMEDIFITNFVCGVTTSVNGLTTNAELIKITKVQFENCKTCIVGCQAQEKLNVINHAACWGGTHTFFYSGKSGGYGAVTPGHWVIDGVNIAGAVNTLIQRVGTGYFPLHVRNVYAESLGTIGTWTESTGGSFQDSLIDFVGLSVFPAYPSAGNFSGSGVTFKNTSFRYYGTLYPVVLLGGVFENCTFDVLPYITGELRNCVISANHGSSYAFPSNDEIDQKQVASRYLSGGNKRYIDSLNYSQGKELSLLQASPAVGGILSLDNLVNATSTYTITSNTATVTPPAARDLTSAIVGNLVINLSTGQIMGIITSIGASTYAISYVPVGITSGTGVLGQYHPVYNVSLMGTITAGSSSITNVVVDFGSISDVMSNGGFVKFPGFYGFRAYSQQARILAYNATTQVITMDRPASESASNYYFASNGAIKQIKTNSDSSGSGSAISASEIFPKGSEFLDDVPNSGKRKFIVTVTGYYTNVPQATLVEIT